MDSPKPNFPVKYFRSLTQKEGCALLGKLVELGQKRDPPTLRPFLEYLEADGFSASYVLRKNLIDAMPDPKKTILPIGAVPKKSLGNVRSTHTKRARAHGLIKMRVKPRPSGRGRKARSDIENVAATDDLFHK